MNAKEQRFAKDLMDLIKHNVDEIGFFQVNEAMQMIAMFSKVMEFERQFKLDMKNEMHKETMINLLKTFYINNIPVAMSEAQNKKSLFIVRNEDK